MRLSWIPTTHLEESLGTSSSFLTIPRELTFSWTLWAPASTNWISSFMPCPACRTHSLTSLKVDADLEFDSFSYLQYMSSKDPDTCSRLYKRFAEITGVKMVLHYNSPSMLKFCGRQPWSSKSPSAAAFSTNISTNMPLFSPHPPYPNSCWFVTLTASAPSASLSLTRVLGEGSLTTPGATY